MYLLPYCSNQRLNYGADLMAAYSPTVVVGVRGGTPRYIGHFEIDLGKFGLSIFATILVAETFCKLEILFNRT